MAPTRSKIHETRLISNLSMMMSIMTGLSFLLVSIQVSSAQSPSNRQGIWVPIEGDIGQRVISHVIQGGDDKLFAIGSGIVWRLNAQNEDTPDTEWVKLGRYAPSLSWDESIGVNASGPFQPSLLAEVERQVGESIEASLDAQGDEDWISEDSALSLIEAFEEEISPAVDSPYRVNAVFPQQQGIWLATGAGLWVTQQDLGVHPLSNSPKPTISVTQLDHELWVSTGDQIKRTAQYLDYVTNATSGDQPEQDLKWLTHSNSSTMTILNYMGIGYVFVDGQLIELGGTHKKATHTLPKGTHFVSVNADSNQPNQTKLWALTHEGVWFTDPKSNESFTWQRCVPIYAPMTHLKVNDQGLFLISDEVILSISSDCQRVTAYDTPLGEGVIFTDASWWEGKIYAATSGGLFFWEEEASLNISRVALKYLKRDLEIFPKFFDVYKTALREQNLEPSMNGYGMRPVLSALMPQLTMRYTTRPSRGDTVPTFFVGSRQLTLLQPTPEYSLFLEWRLSLDFLTALVDPERGSIYFEAQNQIETLIEDPLASGDLESEVGLFEDWTNDTFTSQAQRLAMTTLALERRQKHRDRAQLRSRVARLHRERVKLTYQRWLRSDVENSLKQSESLLRLQELDAHLDAITGYRLQIQYKMNPSL